jgi:TonB family protein
MKCLRVFCLVLLFATTTAGAQRAIIHFEQGPYDRWADTSHVRYWTPDLATSDPTVLVRFEVRGRENGRGERYFDTRTLMLHGPGVQPRVLREERFPFSEYAIVEYIINEQRGSFMSRLPPQGRRSGQFSADAIFLGPYCATTQVEFRVGNREIALPLHTVNAWAMLFEAAPISNVHSDCGEDDYGLSIRRVSDPLTIWRPALNQQCVFDHRAARIAFGRMFRGHTLAYVLRSLPRGAGGLLEITWDSAGAPSVHVVPAPVSEKVPSDDVLQALRQTVLYLRPEIGRARPQSGAVLISVETGHEAEVLIGESFYCPPRMENPEEFLAALRVTARRAGRGLVVLSLRVDQDGGVSRVDVFQPSGNPLVDAAALEAITVAKWLPGVVRGQLTPLWVALPINID